jgi:hypothetical protein
MVTARGTPRKAKKGPFTMAAIGKFCEEIDLMDPIPSKGQIYEALSVVLPKREGTAAHRDETRRTFFKPLDSEFNLEDIGTAEVGAFDEVFGPTGAINESEPTTLDTFDMISSSNERALSNAARALIVDLTEGELSIVSSTEHESFEVTTDPTIVQGLLNKIRNFAEQYWVNERDLLLEAAFLSKESMKNED